MSKSKGNSESKEPAKSCEFFCGLIIMVVIFLALHTLASDSPLESVMNTIGFERVSE